MGIKHAHNATQSDGANSDLLQPSHWNADHVFEELTMGGDLLYMNPTGGEVLLEEAGPFYTAGGGEYLGTRVTGLTTGHTIRLEWQAKRIGGACEQWLKATGPGGGSILAQIQAADNDNTSYIAYSKDLDLTSGATEIQYWTTVNSAEIRVLKWTDLDAASLDRLPIGEEGQVLTVRSGVPVWE